MSEEIPFDIDELTHDELMHPDIPTSVVIEHSRRLIEKTDRLLAHLRSLTEKE